VDVLLVGVCVAIAVGAYLAYSKYRASAALQKELLAAGETVRARNSGRTNQCEICEETATVKIVAVQSQYRNDPQGRVYFSLCQQCAARAAGKNRLWVERQATVRLRSADKRCEICGRSDVKIKCFPSQGNGADGKIYFRLCMKCTERCKDLSPWKPAGWIWRQVEDSMTHGYPLGPADYQTYLRSPEWQKQRLAALKRAGNRCQMDALHLGQLHVHHNTYDRLGREKPEDLIVLCENCHVLFHGKVPLT
jgi:hypothetical protein